MTRLKSVKILIVLLTAFVHSKSQTVVIDAGHGYCNDCTQGCTSSVRLDVEIETAMATTLKLNNLLANCPTVTTFLTRNSNACGDFPGVTARSTMANSWGADLFLSIHTNGFNGIVNGTETIYNTNILPTQCINFATLCQNEIQPIGPFNDRGVKRDVTALGINLGVLSTNNAISCLSEIAFGDNTSDSLILIQDSKRDLFAAGFYNAIQQQLGLSCTTSSTCISPTPIYCGIAYDGTTVNGQDLIDIYGCSSLDERGPEVIHKFTITKKSDIDITLYNINVDLDLHLLTDSCDPNSCIASDNNQIVYSDLNAGTYYVSVDGYGIPGNEGGYTLVLNCNPTLQPPGHCGNPIQLTCGTSYTNTTNDGQDLMNTYGCGFQLEYGKEKIHKFTISSVSDVTIALTNLTRDLDIYLLTDSCNPNSCINRDDNSITQNSLSPGTYYVVVDGFGNPGFQGSYTIDLNCSAPTTPIGYCSNPIPISCGVTYNGSTSNGQDVINTYSCGTQLEYGKEKIHKFTLTSLSDITINLTGLSADLDIHLLTDSCDPNSCIDRDDNSITHTNLSPGTYYISVDGFGNPGNESAYTLDLNCNTITQPPGFCFNPIPLLCGTPYTDSTNNGQDLMDTYSCSPQSQYGNEKIHEFTIQNLSDVTINLTGLSANLDIHLLTDPCDPNSCIDNGDTSIIQNNLSPGTYYISVDGFGNPGTVGTYTLNLNCATIIQPPGFCYNPIPISCGIPYSDSTNNGQDLIDVYNCGSQLEYGKEKIHEFTLTTASDITIDLTGLSADLDIHLLTDACDPNSCINRDDNSIIQNNLSAGTYYISVDGFGNPGVESAYILTLNCVALGNPPICSFSASQTNIVAGNSIDFTDNSLNNPTSWNWDFGGGSIPNTSNTQNPTGIIFNTAGIYTVTLNASNSFGTCSSSSVNINVSAPNQSPLGHCGNPILIQCGDIYNGNTSTGQDVMNTYSCAVGVPQFGNEVLHEFTITSQTDVTISLTNIGTINLDINLLTDSCDQFSCIAGGQDQITYPDLQPGTYYITVDESGPATQTQSGNYTLELDCSDITISVFENEKEKLGISVYPNPASNFTTIVSKENKKYSYQIYSSGGKLIAENKFTNYTKINLNTFDNGLYFVKVSDGIKTEFIKLIKN